MRKDLKSWIFRLSSFKILKEFIVATQLSISYSSILHHKNDSNDESVKSESLSEDHHKDESNENVVLSIGANTCITNNTDSKTSSQ